jgi:hypothetical protein
LIANQGDSAATATRFHQRLTSLYLDCGGMISSERWILVADVPNKSAPFETGIPLDRTDLVSFCEALTRGPSTLLCGQDLLKRYSGTDVFLSACAHRFGSDAAMTYCDLLELWSDEPAE